MGKMVLRDGIGVKGDVGWNTGAPSARRTCKGCLELVAMWRRNGIGCVDGLGINVGKKVELPGNGSHGVTRVYDVNIAVRPQEFMSGKEVGG